MKLIDIHCHILPEIDDGPRNMEASLDLARGLKEAGVHTVAATPHLREDHPRVRPREIAARCRRLRTELDAAGVDLALVPGGEVDLVWAMEASDEELRLVSLSQRGTDLLVETPYGLLTSSFEELLFGLMLKGYRIVLAHPERNPSFQQDTDRLAALVGRGTLVQLTVTSLSNPPNRSRSGNLARRLLRNGLAHILASDAHGVHTFDRMLFGPALEVARQLVGSRADWMVTEAPAAVLAGELLPAQPAGRRRRWRDRFASRVSEP